MNLTVAAIVRVIFMLHEKKKKKHACFFYGYVSFDAVL